MKYILERYLIWINLSSKEKYWFSSQTNRLAKFLWYFIILLLFSFIRKEIKEIDSDQQLFMFFHKKNQIDDVIKIMIFVSVFLFFILFEILNFMYQVKGLSDGEIKALLQSAQPSMHSLENKFRRSNMIMLSIYLSVVLMVSCKLIFGETNMETFSVGISSFLILSFIFCSCIRKKFSQNTG